MTNLEKFVDALVNYDLFGEPKLLKYGLGFFVAMNHFDFDKAKKYQKKFSLIIYFLELEGTNDLVDPVLKTVIPD